MKKAITIEGMSCEHCVRHVTEALKELSGVENVEVNLSTGRAIVDTKGEVLDSSIRSAVEEAGYDVTGIVEA